MMERLGETYQSLQGLEAARQFQSVRKNASVFRQADILLPEKTPDASPAPLPQAAPPALPDPPAASQRNNPLAHLEPIISEVRDIAQAVGYLGVSSEDIIRAYRSGDSLLADYKV